MNHPSVAHRSCNGDWHSVGHLLCWEAANTSRAALTVYVKSSQGVSAAVKVPDELLQAVDTLRGLSDKAAKAARKADAPELAAKHRAFAGDLSLDRSLPCAAG